MKLHRLSLAFVVLCALLPAHGASGKAASILPQRFGGWDLQDNLQSSADPALADPVNAAVLKEYGFSAFESGVYTRDDGRKLTLKAARFADASGAYGAFTYYKVPQMQAEKIGDQGASYNERVMFYRGNILVDAQFERLSAMSAAELRDLSEMLPLPSSNAGRLPGLPAYLPAADYVRNSAKYIIGPVALDKIGAPLTAQQVDFNAGAEVVLGTYKLSDTNATLMLIAYPTPQIAASHARVIDAAAQQLSASNSKIFDRRTGPILALVNGDVSASQARSLLSLINYEADVTWNQNTFFSRRDDAGNLLVNVIYLSAIIGGFAVISGVAFGGMRILLKRFYPGKVFDREDMELISLHLSGEPFGDETQRLTP